MSLITRLYHVLPFDPELTRPLFSNLAKRADGSGIFNGYFQLINSNLNSDKNVNKTKPKLTKVLSKLCMCFINFNF